MKSYLLPVDPFDNEVSHLLGGAMPHIYSNVRALEGEPPVGEGDCVELVQKYTNVGWTGAWRPWVRVIDAGYIRVGTVIATFDKRGRYPGKKTGNDAAFFLGMGPLDSTTGRPHYIVVMEQWKGLPKIKERAIYGKGRLAHIPGGLSESNIFDNFWVVE
jgi:hypothetical protein